MKRLTLFFTVAICVSVLINLNAQTNQSTYFTNLNYSPKSTDQILGKVQFKPVSNVVPKGRFNSVSIADFWHKRTSTSNQSNLIWWSPFLKGGAGVISRADGTSTKYAGGFYHPKLKKGEIITAGHYVNSGNSTSYEFKAEYRFPDRIGVGGGIVDFGEVKTMFLKTDYLNNIGNWNYILGLMWHRVDKTWLPGSYGILYDKNKLFGLGYDGEEWRATIGYISPETHRRIRPAFELFWLDRNPGTLANNRFVLFMGTLGYRGGILSQSARIGRAMGASGLEYSNPIIFLGPSWNRLLNVWEQGGIADIRTVFFEGSEGNYSAKTEAILWGFQLDRKKNILDGIFAGGYHIKTNTNHSFGTTLGIKHRFNNFGIMAQSEYDFASQKVIINAGISMLFR